MVFSDSCDCVPNCRGPPGSDESREGALLPDHFRCKARGIESTLPTYDAHCWMGAHGRGRQQTPLPGFLCLGEAPEVLEGLALV